MSVKVEMKSEADDNDNDVRSLKPVPYPITDLQHKTVVNFWKSWKGAAVIASIAALVYVLFF